MMVVDTEGSVVLYFRFSLLLKPSGYVSRMSNLLLVSVVVGLIFVN
jgi:hypothetical protein